MNIRIDTRTNITYLQVDEHQWVKLEDAMADANKQNLTLRPYLLEKYGKIWKYDSSAEPVVATDPVGYITSWTQWISRFFR
jgi:hypothetical protein